MASLLKNWLPAFTKNARDNSLLWRLLRDSIPEHKTKYFVAILAMIVVAGTTASTAWLMGEIVDAMTDTGNRARVYWVAGAVALTFMAKGIASFAQAVLMARAGNRIVAEKQTTLYNRLLKQGVGFFSTTESSDILMRVTNSAQRARMVIDTIVTSVVRDTLTLIGLICVMIYQQPVLSIVSLVVGPVALWGVQKILARVRDVMKQELKSLAEIIKVVQETSTGVRVIKTFALEGVMRDRMDQAVRSVERRNNKIVRLENATAPLMDTITGLAIASVVVLSSVNLFGGEPSSPGQLMSFVTAFLMAYEPAKRLMRMRVKIEHGMVGVRLMFELLDKPITLHEAENPVVLADGPGHVTFDNVGFSYTDGKSIIRDMTLDFPAGKTTALVGPSGGGKSTILNLILRLYDPQEGSIRIDDVDIREASFASLREKISYVGQDTFLFSSSVAENIRIARPDATDDEVVSAARIAHADEFIRDMPKGYQTKIGENGAFLSGGQRQRLAIARAVLKDAPILVLDEATSALDANSEALVKSALDQVTQGKTTIVVAHRLSTVIHADQICYLEDGRVVEQGTRDELLSKGEKFRDLYEMQLLE
ncbi:ATP-binding cassette, subfamily B [Lutimaribacter pacificus]|uniref:ATP-binding cassette, subfamily B n=1 Tax=Lutimaribacter pacificus TaxID=391948 RepID=A0A1H0D3H8_9RHOB|nr:ABC transporter ATP-binding protein [Lutimaribacter pacificus]SDN64665.1 ATP-binding cassette, subfamily B [Lutimaribacter pacificus]SHJ37378.1 ATP-binding cassette, subfamily B [Lutimaribacter pacificus]